MTTRQEIVAEARSWIGTPFHHHAEIKSVGVDCIHLPIGVCKNLGLIPVDFRVPDYGLQTNGADLMAHCEKNLIRITQQELRAGDIVILAIDVYPQHIGIVADYVYGGLSIIHAASSRSVAPSRVVETRLVFSRVMKFVAAYRIPGVL